MKLFKSAIFWLFFVIPMTLGITYYHQYASKQYKATAHFTIEKTGKAQSDPFGFLTGLSGNVPSTRDALIIKDFIESREVIERTKKDFDIRKMYMREDKDWLSRLKSDASMEDIVDYWKSKVSIEFNTTTGIAHLSVLAFEPEDSITIINAIMKESQKLVNDLSDQARKDSLKFAKKELNAAQDHLKKVRGEVSKFRDNEKILNPEKDIEAKVSLVTNLEAQLATAEAELMSLRAALHDNSPKVKAALNKYQSLKRQVKKVRNRVYRNSNKKSKKTIGSLLAKQQSLLTDQEFAEKAYASALLNKQQATIEATQQHLYLTTIVNPQLPEKAAKPDQPHDYIVLFLGCLLLWGIVGLIIASVRDHAGWV